MVNEKKCRSCGRILPLKSYYRCSAVKDGRKARCKECLGNEQKERLKDPDVRERRRAYSREWNTSPRGKRYHRQYKKTEEYKQKELRRRKRVRNVSKVKARCAVKDALRYDRLDRKPCAVCGNEEAEAHHIFGYERDNWTEVIWLCKTHHLKAEERIRNERENLQTGR